MRLIDADALKERIGKICDESEEKADLCEKNHKTLQKAEYEEVYRSQNSVPDGWPTKIRVKVRNGDYIVYRR